MRSLAAVLLLAVLLAAASTAQADTTIIEPPASAFPYQRWVDRAEVPTPSAEIAVEEDGFCEGTAAGCADSADTIGIEVGLIRRDYADPRRTAQAVLYHELGHEVDYLELKPWMRRRFMAILDLHGPWRPADTRRGGPDELFADAWAQCALHAVTPPFRYGVGPFWQHGPIGGRERHDRICRMLARLGN